MSNQPVRVAVTGAAGQIGYSLVFRIAAGEMLGPDQQVILQMLEIEPALPALQGNRGAVDGHRCSSAETLYLAGEVETGIAQRAARSWRQY